VVFLLIGVGLLGVILYETDLVEVVGRLGQIGAVGVLVVLALYFTAFVIDTVSWQLTLPSVRLDLGWLYRLWKVRMVGEAFNNLIPAATLGGEPVKAVLMKKGYGIGYREGGASLVIAKTVNLLALIAFLALGYALMVRAEWLPVPYGLAAGIGLAVFTLGVGAFAVAQPARFWSWAGGRLSTHHWFRRLAAAMPHIEDMDDRFVDFYWGRRGRFAVAVGLALVNWAIGAVELYYVMRFLGHPISLTDAWVIEAAVQLVRSGAFFIPAGIGMQEGAFFVIIALLTGQPALGLAVAAVRRFREVVWIAWGLVLGWLSPIDGMLAAADLRNARKP
jgi:uncharacterized protein (TIRG00374 family)